MINTATAVTAAPNPSGLGASVTLTATVTPNSQPFNPNGTVTFYDSGVQIGAPQPAVLEPKTTIFTAKLTISTLAVGSHSITATFSNDTNYATSTSAIYTQTVMPATTTVVTSNSNPSGYLSAVTFTATITPTSVNGNMTGTVNFYKDGAYFGQSAVTWNATTNTGSAAVAINSLSIGSHTITASFFPTSGYSQSQSAALTQAVNVITSMVLSSSLNPSTFGADVTLAAAITPNSIEGEPTGTVTFFDGANQIGLPQNVSYETKASAFYANLTTSSLSAGAHSLKAVYSGDGTYRTSTSQTLNEQVNN